MTIRKNYPEPHYHVITTNKNWAVVGSGSLRRLRTNIKRDAAIKFALSLCINGGTIFVHDSSAEVREIYVVTRRKT